MPDAQDAASDRVGGRDVGRAVVGQQLLNGDAVALEELDCAAQEPDRRRGLLVVEDFGVGQASGVVDADMDEVPACRASIDAGSVAAPRLGVGASAGDALAGAALDAAELLDIDVDELARPSPFVALSRLKPDPAQAAQSFALEHRADC